MSMMRLGLPGCPAMIARWASKPAMNRPRSASQLIDVNFGILRPKGANTGADLSPL